MSYKPNIKKYLPTIYKGILETDVLTDVENMLFKELEKESIALENNQFIMTSDSDRLKLLEKLFNINAKPELETLEFRRQRLIDALIIDPPYTIRYLKMKLDQMLGEGNYNIILHSKTYKIKIETIIVSKEVLNDFLRTIVAIIPVNLAIILENILEHELDGKIYLLGGADQSWNADLIMFPEVIEYNYSEGTEIKFSTVINNGLIYDLTMNFISELDLLTTNNITGITNSAIIYDLY